jgi:ABC-type microcin C transport system permease subunit YejB
VGGPQMIWKPQSSTLRILLALIILFVLFFPAVLSLVAGITDINLAWSIIVVACALISMLAPKQLSIALLVLFAIALAFQPVPLWLDVTRDTLRIDLSQQMFEESWRFILFFFAISLGGFLWCRHLLRNDGKSSNF